jgi:tRNA threonylcarbamoyladenosine biosynthesis protein TsaB
MARRPELLLAIESAVAPSVALLRGEVVIAERACAAPAAETLLPAIAALLEEASATLDDVGAYAISIGPGSFTGLRVGLSTLKGLAFGSDAPAFAVPTLAALAAEAPEGAGPVAALLDARRGELYAAAFEADGRAGAWLPEGVYAAGDLLARLPRPCRAVGEGARLLAGLDHGGVSLHPDCVPTAAAVGRLALREQAGGGGAAAAALVPRYVRRAEAEVRRTGHRVEAGAADGNAARPPGESL